VLSHCLLLRCLVVGGAKPLLRSLPACLHCRPETVMLIALGCYSFLFVVSSLRFFVHAALLISTQAYKETRKKARLRWTQVEQRID